MPVCPGECSPFRVCSVSCVVCVAYSVSRIVCVVCVVCMLLRVTDVRPRSQ